MDITVNENRLVEIFLELVRIDAVSLNERPMADHVQNRLATLGVAVAEDGAAAKLNGSSGNLIARRFINASEQPLLLTAHLDTVKSTAGVQPIIEDGMIKSDGNTILGADNRAGVAVLLYVLEELQRNSYPVRDLEIVFTVAEELGMLGAMALDFNRLKAREGYILDCSRRPGCYVALTPTAMDFKVEFLGRSAHSGVHPEAGINAISMAVEALAHFAVGRIDDDTVANVGTIHGGSAINVVPDQVTITGEIRSFSRSQVDQIIDTFKNHLLRIAGKYGGRIEPSFTVGFEGFILGQELPVIQRLEKSLARLDLVPDALRYYGGSDANVFNNRGIATVNLGIGAMNPHANNEYIRIQDLVNTARLVLHLIRREEA